MTLCVYPIAGQPKNICAGYAYRTASDGTQKLHDACDLCAPEGSALVAVDGGEVSWGTDPVGGNVAVLHTPSGVAYYYAHLLDQRSGSKQVQTGDQIGRVGMSGNAQGTVYHCHFQVWPTGSFDQGTVHPDPTQELLQAPVLTSPNGQLTKMEWGLIAAASLGAAAGLYVGAREGLFAEILKRIRRLRTA